MVLCRWFSVTMGTGIVSILLHNLPYNADWIYWISVVIFILNVMLFMLFLLISIVRYTVYKGIFFAMLRHPVQSLFLGTLQPRKFPAHPLANDVQGTFPMGLATIVNMIAYVCIPAWGPWVVSLTWALWWIDAVISAACCMFLPFAM
jgi:tellurite resistance protein TehA-like permease